MRWGRQQSWEMRGGEVLDVEAQFHSGRKRVVLGIKYQPIEMIVKRVNAAKSLLFICKNTPLNDGTSLAQQQSQSRSQTQAQGRLAR